MRLDLMGIKHDKPIGALKDTIAICRGIWEGNALTYSGSNYAVKNVKALIGKPQEEDTYILSLGGRGRC